MELQEEATAVEPEQVLVLETIGSVNDFFRGIANTPGLDWLTEWDEEFEPDEEIYREGDRERPVGGRAYLAVFNQQGLQQLQSLWERYEQNPDDPGFRRGLKTWRRVFQRLRDLRPWGPQDRLYETGLLEDWQRRVEAGEETAHVEVELWFRQDANRRRASAAEVGRLVEGVGGAEISSRILEPINYHGMLAELPIEQVGELVRNRESRLVKCDQVMFFRPAGQARATVPEGETEEFRAPPEDLGAPAGDPIVALLDGLPQENHAWLRGRLTVDDPENWAARYPVGERRHGTAMASLVIHGSLDAQGEPLGRPLYVRPVLKPSGAPWTTRTESVPEDRLAVDLIHSAVTRLFEGGEDGEGAAPSVRVINLSLGDSNRPFYRHPSAWARLLDYLSVKYNVLFVVSAGNHPHELEFDTDFARPEDFEQASAEELGSKTVRILNDTGWDRRLLSPAESINSLTVGASHADFTDATNPTGLVDPIPANGEVVSPVSAIGYGVRRSLKPDVLLPGGRQLFRLAATGGSGRGASLIPVESFRPPGLRTAMPRETGVTNSTAYLRGTSNAAALASRIAAKICSTLEDLHEEPGGDRIENEFIPVLTKAVLVHGAQWGSAERLIENALDVEHGRQLKHFCMRLLGYGTVDLDRTEGCTAQRATMLGFGSLAAGQAERYEIPLPPSLSGEAIWRRLRLTLAWFSPVNPAHRGYRRAALWVTPYGAERRGDDDARERLRLSSTAADWQASRRGTVQHELLEGDEATAFVDGDQLSLQVNCRDDAGSFDGRARYGLAATLEVSPEIDVPIYNEVQARIRPRVEVGVQE